MSRMDNVGVVKVARYAGALAVVAAGCAGCGGSHRRSIVGPRATRPSVPAISAPDPTALRDTSTGSMLCTVYESGYATQVIFASQSFDVRADCRAWTQDKAAAGYLWGYQPVRATDAPTESRQVCSLTDPAGLVAAQVIEATGLRAVSAAESARATSACNSLLASGWIEPSRSAQSRGPAKRRRGRRPR